MATQKEDTVTRELFDNDERTMINDAMETYQATLKRRANSENNPQIKQIRENDVRRAAALLNKLQGL